MYPKIISLEDVVWNVTPNKYTCPTLVNAVMNAGIPLNAKIIFLV